MRWSDRHCREASVPLVTAAVAKYAISIAKQSKRPEKKLCWAVRPVCWPWPCAAVWLGSPLDSCESCHWESIRRDCRERFDLKQVMRKCQSENLARRSWKGLYRDRDGKDYQGHPAMRQNCLSRVGSVWFTSSAACAQGMWDWKPLQNKVQFSQP